MSQSVVCAERRLGLFEAAGVELEYMIVDRGSLDVRPLADELFRRATGQRRSDVEFPDVTWSNELVLHVVELKTTAPAASLAGLVAAFQGHVRRIDELLAPLGARLMPTAMHPWMDPQREMRLWPHDQHAVYEAFHRAFDCRGHGWANLQSAHLNLPFADDHEFGRLHAAIRLLLPLLPALAASSPVVEGRPTGLMDNRMERYRTNARRIPSIAGRVVPEPVFSESEYRRRIFEPMFADIAPFDPAGLLRDEFLNARGAIPRFGRGSIEIRVLDVQECPAADLAILAAVTAVLAALVAQRWSSLAAQQAFPTDSLVQLLRATIRDADQAVVDDRRYLELLGAPAGHAPTAGNLWKRLAGDLGLAGDVDRALRVILEQGPLARRILRALGGDFSPARLRKTYRRLCDCLAAGALFPGESC
jgi:gamma-glutamyl:cysteine ligase YbdK (ATP-grasp superfamily)